MLSKRDRRKVFEEIKSLYNNIVFDKKAVVEIYEDKEIGKILIVDGTPSFFLYRDKWMPHLKYLLRHGLEGFPYIVVDKGAVKPLLRGADLMVPGIRRIYGLFRKSDTVVVVEEVMGKPFMVGIALLDSDQIVGGGVKKGRAVENIHRIGDKFWDIV